MKRFTGTFCWAQTSYLWRVSIWIMHYSDPPNLNFLRFLGHYVFFRKCSGRFSKAENSYQTIFILFIYESFAVWFFCILLLWWEYVVLGRIPKFAITSNLNSELQKKTKFQTKFGKIWPKSEHVPNHCQTRTSNFANPEFLLRNRTSNLVNTKKPKLEPEHVQVRSIVITRSEGQNWIFLIHMCMQTVISNRCNI